MTRPTPVQTIFTRSAAGSKEHGMSLTMGDCAEVQAYIHEIEQENKTLALKVETLTGNLENAIESRPND
jgi:hypothetical protein